ncbi:MAG: T9SS type A sorting domain-containing protein [Calditrichota bacterium]
MSWPNGVPFTLRLNPAFPNPFNAQTTITFEISHSAFTSLSLYNPLGQQVRQLIPAGWWFEGKYNFTVNASQLPAGKYFIRLETAGRLRSQTVTILK